MNALLSHVWGVSAGQDRVWAQVCGFSPSLAVNRVMVVFQAAIDESYRQGGNFVLAGYVATAEAWAQFSAEWEKLLPLATMDKVGKRRFKMREMTSRLDDVSLFYQVIEKYAALALSCEFNISELENARNRIWVDGASIDWGYINNPYWVSFRMLMDNFHNNRVSEEFRDSLSQVIPTNNQVDFYFDDHSSKRGILGAWDDYIAMRPREVRDLYGATPRFDKEENFFPLQAADFWAWWVRKGSESGTLERIRRGDFGVWKGGNFVHSFHTQFSEDELTHTLMHLVRTVGNVPWNKPIYDAKFHPRPIEPEISPSEPIFQRIKRLWAKRLR